jgi:hypothetical protein
MKTVFARWCLNTGKYLFHCTCRQCLPYCHSEAIGKVAEPKPS